jgi:hypothetical protein
MVLIVLMVVQPLYSISNPLTSLVDKVLQLEFIHVSIAVHVLILACSP